MLEQWRAGLRVSEALDLEVRDLSLDTASPTLRVRSGKGGKTRLVPVHPELHGALSSSLAYGDISQGRIIGILNFGLKTAILPPIRAKSA